MIKPIKSFLAICLMLSFEMTAQETTSDYVNESKPTFGNTSNGNVGGGANIVNVNLYTGIGDVHIPIYENSIDGLSLGVSLNYNTKGIRVDQIASSVGLGWELSAGGSITRQIQGSEDEIIIPWLEPNSGGPNNCLPKAPKIRGSWTGPPSIENNACYEYNSIYTAAESETPDNPSNNLSPDIFSANFAGRSIRFAIQFSPAGAKLYTYPKSEVKVELMVYYGGQNHVISTVGVNYDYPETGLKENDSLLGFLITDEKGNKFTFERGEYQYKTYTSERTTATALYFSTTKWVLTKIETPAGNVITYEYYNPPTALQQVVYPVGQFQKVTETHAHSRTYNVNLVPHTSWNQGGLSFVDSTTHFWGRNTHIKSITYPNGTKVHFNLGSSDRCDLPGQKALESIVIESKYDNVVKNALTYKFNQAYFLSHNWSTDTEVPYTSSCSNIYSSRGLPANGTGMRLALKSIDKIGTDLTSTERYFTFDYNGGHLPDRLSQSRDLYGFYNGATVPVFGGHALGIPAHSGFVVVGPNSGAVVQAPFEYGVDEFQYTSYARIWTLRKVTNGLGGSVAITYDAPNASINLASQSYNFQPGSTVNSNYNALDPDLIGTGVPDGLCVSSLEYSDGYNQNNNTSTHYSYMEGERFYPGGYYWLTTIRAGDNINTNYIQKEWYNSMLNNWDYPFGSNHGFKKVLVTQKNALQEQINKSQHEFSGLENVVLYYNNIPVKTLMVTNGDRFHLCKEVFLREEFLGLPLKITNFDNDNGSHITQTVENKYISRSDQDFTDEQLPEATVKYYYRYPFNNLDPLGDPAKHGYRYVNSLTTYSRPFSSNKVMLSESKTTSYSNGQPMVTSLNYTYDSPTDGDFQFDNLKKVEWIDSKGDPYKKTYKYNYDNNLGLTNPIVSPTDPQKIEGAVISKVSGVNGWTYTNSVEMAPAQIWEAPTVPNLAYVKVGNEETTKNYTYDSRYNVTQTQILDQYNAFIWDNRLGKKVAEVVGAKYDQIAYSSFEGPFAAKGIADENKGNLDFDPGFIIVGNSSDKPITGRYYYLLKTGTSYDVVSKPLENGEKFLMTFWAKQTGFVLTLGSQDITNQCVSITSVNGWTLYKLSFTGTNNSIITMSSSGPDIKVDEVRIHPAKALMNTTTYEPLLGPNSTCDARNVLSYFEYSPQGSLSTIRDIDGNILTQSVNVHQGGNN